MFKSVRIAAVAVLALAALLGSGKPAAAQTNLIQNGGFETGAKSPWFNDFGVDNWSITSATSNSGTFSATDFGNNSLRQNFAPTLTSDISEVSFALKAGVTNGFNAYTLFYTDGNAIQFIVNTNTNWQTFNVTSNLAAGKTLNGIRVFGNSGHDTWLDDVRVISNASVVPEPASLALMLPGLAPLGLTLLRRRRRQA